MRVALILTGGVDRSGRERVIPVLLSLIARLAQRHAVNVYVLRYYERPCTYSLLGATVHDLGRPPGLARQYAALVRALRRDGPFDVLHGYWILPAGLLAAAAGRQFRIPSVVTADSGEFVSLPDIDYGLQRRLRHRLAVRAATGLASRVTVCTRYMQRLARARGCECEVIPLGVDRDIFRPPLPEAGAARQSREDGPPLRLLHVASLNRVKDQPLLLRAFRGVVDRLAPDMVSLDIAGEDTLGGSVQRLGHELGVDDRVTYHGPLPTDALTSLYRRAHAVVISSRHEAASVVALEAAASGVPIVGTRVGYLDDWAADAATSIASFDADDLADAITALLRDPQRRLASAEAARAWALAHDADWTAAQFERLYRTLRVPA